MKTERMAEVRADVIQGVLPTLMEPFLSDPHPIVQAFRDAMALCFHVNPHHRGTAGDVAMILYRALEQQVPDANAAPFEQEAAVAAAEASAHHHPDHQQHHGTHGKKKNKNKKTIHDQQHHAVQGE